MKSFFWLPINEVFLINDTQFDFSLGVSSLKSPSKDVKGGKLPVKWLVSISALEIIPGEPSFIIAQS